VSRKRNPNLGDLVNTWKKEVLATELKEAELNENNMDIRM